MNTFSEELAVSLILQTHAVLLFPNWFCNLFTFPHFSSLFRRQHFSPWFQYRFSLTLSCGRSTFSFRVKTVPTRPCFFHLLWSQTPDFLPLTCYGTQSGMSVALPSLSQWTYRCPGDLTSVGFTARYKDKCCKNNQFSYKVGSF